MAKKSALDAAKECLESAQTVYIACHILPDGDAIGSMLGLGGALRRLGKECTLACADPIPFRYDVVPGVEEVVARPPSTEQVIVTVDVSDIERLGTLYDAAIFASRPVVNIDHHVTNTQFGTVNLVLPLPSSAEVVYAVIRRLGAPLDPAIATALLTGLVTDTRCFRTGNVTTQQLRTAIQWMEAGAPLAHITEQVYNRESPATICLWGQALSSAQTRGRLVWTGIDQHMMRKCQASPNEGDGLVSFLASTMGVNVAVVFREKDDGRIEASMRAGPGWDISGVAQRLGGGGHPRAAGCTIAGTMSEVQERVLSEIENALAEQAQARQ